MTQRDESDIAGLTDDELARAAVEPWEELQRLRRSASALYLGIGFLEGFATGLQFHSATDRTRAAEQIRDAAVELRELLP